MGVNDKNGGSDPRPQGESNVHIQPNIFSKMVSLLNFDTTTRHFGAGLEKGLPAYNTCISRC